MTRTERLGLEGHGDPHKFSRRGTAFSSSGIGWWLAGGMVCAGIILALNYFDWGAPEKLQPTIPAIDDGLQVMPKSGVEPTLRPPRLVPEPSLESAESLPPLKDSDGVLHERAAALFSSKSFGDVFYWSDIVRRIVVTVDNLPRKRMARELLPVRPVVGNFVIAGDRAGIVIGPENSERYAAYVAVVESVNSKLLVAAYVRFYPWFQQEFRNLGYPTGAFNDRLVAAIDDLLDSPPVTEPIRLVQPRVMYEFADPSLEDLSAGQKMMLRVGSQNASRLKAKLQELRRELIASEVSRIGR